MRSPLSAGHLAGQDAILLAASVAGPERTQDPDAPGQGNDPALKGPGTEVQPSTPLRGSDGLTGAQRRSATGPVCQQNAAPIIATRKETTALDQYSAQSSSASTRRTRPTKLSYAS
jgi:hypothetical protein